MSRFRPSKVGMLGKYVLREPAYRDDSDPLTQDMLAAMGLIDKAGDWEKAFDALLSILAKISMDGREFQNLAQCDCEELTRMQANVYGMSETCATCMVLELHLERFGHFECNDRLSKIKLEDVGFELYNQYLWEGYPEESMHTVDFAISKRDQRGWYGRRGEEE